MADLGIALVFSDEQERARYFTQSAFSRRLAFRQDLHERFRQDGVAAKLIQTTTDLGRLPIHEEFPELQDLASRFGGMARVGRLTLAAIDSDAFAGSLQDRARDLITYLAKMRLAGERVPKVSALPRELRLDIKATFGSMNRRKTKPLSCCSAWVDPMRCTKPSKRLQSARPLAATSTYIHPRSTIFPLYYGCLSLPPGASWDRWTLAVKFSDHGRAVSFLRYPDFDTDPIRPYARQFVSTSPQARIKSASMAATTRSFPSKRAVCCGGLPRSPTVCRPQRERAVP